MYRQHHRSRGRRWRRRGDGFTNGGDFGRRVGGRTRRRFVGRQCRRHGLDGGRPRLHPHRVSGGRLGSRGPVYDGNPDYRIRGVHGEPVFTDAHTELCAPGDPPFAECSVAEIWQELDIASQLTVFYDVTGPLEGRRLRYGPLPTEALAACEGDVPRVIVGSNGAARGLDAEGNTLWRVEAFSPAEAATGQSTPIVFQVARGE